MAGVCVSECFLRQMWDSRAGGWLAEGLKYTSKPGCLVKAGRVALSVITLVQPW